MDKKWVWVLHLDSRTRFEGVVYTSSYLHHILGKTGTNLPGCGPSSGYSGWTKIFVVWNLMNSQEEGGISDTLEEDYLLGPSSYDYYKLIRRGSQEAMMASLKDYGK